MKKQSAGSLRKPRADAVRNRELVLDAAKAVFNAGGPEASLEAVAKQAKSAPMSARRTCCAP
jgi:hypothetical protein